MRIPPVTPSLLISLALSLTVAGCAPPPSLFDNDVPNPGGSEQDTLISNNAASLSGLVRGPATLISNNGAGYRLLGLDQQPAAQALVYLTAPDERFYAGTDGKALHTLTDSEGRYAFTAAPAGVPVVITVLLANNKRLVGFMIPAKGANEYDVDVATTVAAEFFRDQARLAGKSMADYPALTDELPKIITMTRELLTSGKMPLPDLGVNAIPAMRHAYVRAFGADNQALSDAWKRLLGYRPLLIDEVDAGLDAGLNALSIHVDENGNLYTAGFNDFNLQIRRRKPDGTFEDITKAPRADGVDYVGGMLALDGLLHVGVPTGWNGHYGFDLSKAFTADDLFYNTSLWIRSGWNSSGDAVPFRAFDLAQKEGVFYAASDSTNEIVAYRLFANMALDDDGAQIAESFEVIAGNRADASTFAGDAATAGTTARFNYPTNLTLQAADDQDYLYVSDTLNHRIRRINLSDGVFTTETILGHGLGSTAYGNMLQPPGALENGKLPASKEAGFVDLDHPEGVPKDKASFSYPHKVVFDGQGRMFIADQDHRRVRMFDGVKVYTLAGTDPGVPSAIGDSRRAGLGEVASIAFDADGNLLIADGRSNKLRRLWLKFGL